MILRRCAATLCGFLFATAPVAAAPVLPVLYELEGNIADPGPFTDLDANAPFTVRAIVDPTGDDSGFFESYRVISATLAIGDKTATFSGDALGLSDRTDLPNQIHLRLGTPSDPSVFGGASIRRVQWQARGGDALLNGVAALQPIAIADVALNPFYIFGRDAERRRVSIGPVPVTGIEVSEVPLPASSFLLAPPLAALAWRARARRRPRGS